MARRSIRNSVFIAAFSLAAAALMAGGASARTIRVDVGSSSYDTNGQAWQNSETSIGDAETLAGTLPFAINFGTGYENVTSFCLGEDGFVAFSACSSIDPSTVLRPLAGDWTSVPDPLAQARIFDQGSVTYTTGQLDPEAPIGPLADAPRAIRFHWNDVCTSGVCDFNNNTPRYTFQAILIDVDGDAGGDFDLELNYGFGGIPAGLGTIGFQLGTNSFQHTGAVANEQSFDFQFRNGALVDGPTAVPEPATLPLLALALSTMYALRRRLSR